MLRYIVLVMPESFERIELEGGKEMEVDRTMGAVRCMAQGPGLVGQNYNALDHQTQPIIRYSIALDHQAQASLASDM